MRKTGTAGRRCLPPSKCGTRIWTTAPSNYIQTPEDRKAMLDFIKMLLEKGADPNIRVNEVPPLRSWMYLLGGSLAWVDFTGQTPFLLASLSGDVSTMRLLLEHGADPKIATFGGTTPLMAAAGVNWVFNQTYTRRRACASGSGETLRGTGNGCERQELDGADPADGRRQSRVGLDHRVPGFEGRQTRRERQRRPHRL